MKTTTRPVVLQLDLDASSLLDLFVELGHLDEKTLATVNDRLLDLNRPSGIITADDLRRVVAQVVFESIDELDPEFRRMIEAEWGMLYY